LKTLWAISSASSLISSQTILSHVTLYHSTGATGCYPALSSGKRRISHSLISLRVLTPDILLLIMPGLVFGTSGIPENTWPKTTMAGIRRVAALGLGCMEIAFVRGIYLEAAEARAVAGVARNNKIQISAHAPYYINLNSRDPEKVAASQRRLFKAAQIANLCGADRLVIHAGHYMGDPPAVVYEIVKAQFMALLENLEEDDNPIVLRPEVSGKVAQFGTFDEITRLSGELPRLSPCVDFAHWHARSGSFNSYAEFCGLLDDMQKKLGRGALDNVHFHVSGIEYGRGGEKKHLPLRESDLRYEEMVRAWKDYNLQGRIICESPNQEEDALFLQQLYLKMA